jgi:hypothetical protein
MDCDLSSVLDQWPYDESSSIRRIAGTDGRDKLQVRLPLGIEQYEIDGRPDGLKPEGSESYLEHYEAVARSKGPQWRLSSRDFNRLHEEGLLYYFRYLLFFRIGEYDLCARDTRRNLRLADFVASRAKGEEMAQAVEQYRPYIMRMHAVSLAVKKAKAGDVPAALAMLDDAMEEIEALPSVETQIFRLEKARSLVALRDLKNQLNRQEPFTRVDQLKEELAEAVSDEDYERAADLRDEIRRLNESREPGLRED